MSTDSKSYVKNLKLWHKIVIALILGSLVGLLIGEQATVFAPIGKMFINSIRMIVIPIIFTSVVCSVMAISDVNTMGRLTLKAMAMYIITMAIATGIGLALAIIIKPGMGLPKEMVESALKG